MKDQRIEQLFDDYANELPQQNNLCSRAVNKLNAKRRKKTPNWFARLGVACAAMLVCIICLSAVIPWGGKSDARPESPSADEATSAPTVYARADVVGVKVGAGANLSGDLATIGVDGNVGSLFGSDKLASDNTDLDSDNIGVFGAKYIACYVLKDGNRRLVSVATTYRVYDENYASYCDVVVVCEVNGFVSAELKRTYDNVGSAVVGGMTDKGEYLSQSVVHSSDAHFYVFVYGSQSAQTSQVCNALTSMYRA